MASVELADALLEALALLGVQRGLGDRRHGGAV
jgi:hypothetical protein